MSPPADKVDSLLSGLGNAGICKFILKNTLPQLSIHIEIYVLDLSEAQEVDTSTEESDASDEKITIWGKTYTKANFVAELNKIAGSSFDARTSDEDLIAAVNKLSEAKENKLKEAVESYVAE